VVKKGFPQWIALLEGVAKINVDAAISKSSNTVATMAVTGDANSNFLGASIVVWEGFEDPDGDSRGHGLLRRFSPCI